jgi:hypothetical protein
VDTKKWVDRLIEKRGALERVVDAPLGHMLGCGSWGCVFESTSPWVVKFTIDPTEGAIWTIIKEWSSREQHAADGIVAVREIVRILPDVHVGVAVYPLHAIVREAVQPMYQGDHLSEWTLRELGLPEGYVVDDDMLRRTSEWQSPDITQETIRRAEGLLETIERLLSYRSAAGRWHESRQVLRKNYLLSEATDRAHALQRTRYGALIGESLLSLIQEGIVLRDVHLANVGWRFHTRFGRPGLVIFDPGHTPVASGIEIETVLIEESKEG